jgi:hypothetical protein
LILCAAVALGLSVSFAGPAEADKVGVAAAVNPDAFSSLAGSPQSQLNIGKSIFFNERINTTGSGLVQVLLIDGSTFTVGPGSDLVIDKFVYDPKKGTGQIAASFSKGVMRFVGGKISKGDDAVSIQTPAGALAVRGCIILSKITSSSFAAIMVYGDYMRMGRSSVWQAGTGIFSQNGQVVVREATTADFGAIMAGLTNGNTDGLGTTGTDGEGGPDQALQEANQASQNAASLINQANQTQVQAAITTPNTPQTGGQQPSGPQPETVPLPTTLSLRVLSSPDFYVADQKSFWSPGIFIADPGAHGIVGGDDRKIPCFLSPQVCGGSYYGTFQIQTDDYNVDTTLTGTRMTGTIGQLISRQYQETWPYINYVKTYPASFDVPIFNVVGVHPVTNAVAIDAQGNPVTLTGSAFTGRGGGFFAYQLFEANANGTPNLDKPVLAFGGKPFTPTQTEDQLRLFNLFTDPRQGIAAPFAAAETSPQVLSQPGAGGATIQPVYLLEDKSPGGRSVWLQTSFLISNGPTGQESILVLALGEQNPDGQLVGLRRGMSHAEIFVDDDLDPATAKVSHGIQTINLTGSIATLAGPDGQSYLFGDTIPHFVIGADSTGTGHNVFQDEPLHPEAFAPGGLSLTEGLDVANFTHGPTTSAFTGATYHIGEQAPGGQVNASTVTPVTTGADVDLYGYAAGIYQQTPAGEDEVGILANTTASEVHLKFKDDHRLSALFALSDAGDNGGGGATLAFGDWGTAHGRSAVINGNIYAAVESATVKSTATVENGYGDGHHSVVADASLYLVSSGLLGTTGNVQLCTGCDFMKWGTWGGQLQFNDSGGPVTADVNLGWYVVGNLTTDTQLNDHATWLATGPSATYNGTAIGNVASLNTQTQAWSTYVATGDLAMNWDFAKRSGNLSISKFDTSAIPGGLTFVGAMCAPGVAGCNTPTGNHFGGPLGAAASAPNTTLPANLSDLAGSAVGSFVNNGQTVAAGVIGNWNVHNDVYGATGIFGGRR